MLALNFIVVYGMHLVNTGEGLLRLIGGDNPYEGRLEIYDENEWKSVCYDQWINKNTKVACREMGFEGGGRRRGTSERGTGRFWIVGLRCSGDESLLEECRVISPPYCSRFSWITDDLYVTCDPPIVDILRLEGGKTQYEGQLEIYHDEKWGTICDHYWEKHPQNAEVACRQLGYSGGTYKTVSTSERVSTAETWMDDVQCIGNESRITHCTFRKWGRENCSYFDIVFLTCEPKADRLIRLSDGPNKYEGRLEVYYAGEWGSVCINQWKSHMLNAHVACRQLGFTGGVFRSVKNQERGAGRFWMDEIECQGDEIRLEDCTFNGWGNVNCTHSTNEVYVLCNPNQADLRLLKGGTANEYRVEMFTKGTWHSVCGDAWEDENGKTVCRQLGFTGGESRTQDSTQDRLWTESYECNGDEKFLAKCEIDSNYCDGDTEAVVSCVRNVPFNSICTNTSQCQSNTECKFVQDSQKCACADETKTFWNPGIQLCSQISSINDFCPLNITKSCESNLLCQQTEDLNRCLCEKDHFWENRTEICKPDLWHNENCDPISPDRCLGDLKCTKLSGSISHTCRCPSDQLFWDSDTRSCQIIDTLYAIFVADKQNNTEAELLCQRTFNGRLATVEHKQNVFSNCLDNIKDIWLKSIPGNVLGTINEGCVSLKQDQLISNTDCSELKPFVCIVNGTTFDVGTGNNNIITGSRSYEIGDNRNLSKCVDFPTTKFGGLHEDDSSGGLIGGVVVAVIVLLGICIAVGWFVVCRRRHDIHKHSENKDGSKKDVSREDRSMSVHNTLYVNDGEYQHTYTEVVDNSQHPPQYYSESSVATENNRPKEHNHIYSNDVVGNRTTKDEISNCYSNTNFYDMPGKSSRPANEIYSVANLSNDSVLEQTGGKSAPVRSESVKYDSFRNEDGEKYEYSQMHISLEDYNTFSKPSTDNDPDESYDHLCTAPEDDYNELQNNGNIKVICTFDDENESRNPELPY